MVIVPAGSRGVVLWWGRVETRLMNEGLNFKVPLAETVMKVDVRVQPHPFREIDALSKEYQIVKSMDRWNGMLPQVSGGAVPFLDLGKLSRAAEGPETDKR